MTTKLNLLMLVALTSALFTGCATQNGGPPATPAIVRATVSAGVSFGLAEDPSIKPYLQAATPVICDAAGQGKVNPADVVAALQQSDANQFKSPTAVAIINSAIAVYEVVYAYYGTNVQTSVVQPYLEGVCLGLRDVVPPLTPPPGGGVVRGNALPKLLPPHISMRN